MQFVEPENIVRRLFENYYAKLQDAGEIYTSSHWRQLHKEAKVNFDKDTLVSLAGSGFGDLQNCSLVYRFFSWLTIIIYLVVLKERRKILQLLPAALQLSKKMGLYFTYDAFRQVCVLAVLESYFEKPGARIINIGDGYGFLSALIKNKYPDAKIFLIDLGKTLLFQAYFCQKFFPQSSHLLGTSIEQVLGGADFVYCPAENLEILNSQKFDIAINIASMQEMNIATVNRYFEFLRRNIGADGVFYCCNREEKIMPGGEVSRLADYPWDKEDKHLWDEICPWYRFFLSYHRAMRGPKIGKIRLPFVNYFDGNIRHRLTKLKRSAEGN